MQMNPEMVAFGARIWNEYWTELLFKPMTNKDVVIEVTFTLLRKVRANWKPEDVEFWLNESSHCLSTELGVLMDEEERAGDGCCFTCHRAKAKYLREASPEDVERLTPPIPGQHSDGESMRTNHLR